MEATIFTGWIYDHLLPHAEKVKVAHPLLIFQGTLEQAREKVLQERSRLQGSASPR